MRMTEKNNIQLFRKMQTRICATHKTTRRGPSLCNYFRKGIKSQQSHRHAGRQHEGCPSSSDDSTGVKQTSATAAADGFIVAFSRRVAMQTGVDEPLQSM